MEAFQTIDSTMEEILDLQALQSQDISSFTLNSRDILQLLISEVQAYPILWNKAALEYRETQKKRLLWAEIANRLNVTVDFAKTKWKNLSDSFKSQSGLDTKNPNMPLLQPTALPPRCPYKSEDIK